MNTQITLVFWQQFDVWQISIGSAIGNSKGMGLHRHFKNALLEAVRMMADASFTHIKIIGTEEVFDVHQVSDAVILEAVLKFG